MPIEFPRGVPLPAGLREFAEADDIPQKHFDALRAAHSTMRGRKPATVEEWRFLYKNVRDIFEEAFGV